MADRGQAARRVVAVAIPVVMPAAMTAVFRAAGRRFGARGGYVAGFAVYWAVCLGLSVALVGPRRLARRFLSLPAARVGPGPSTVDRLVETVLLVWPPAGAIATRFLPQIADATPVEVATIAAVAVTNAIAEEALWRAVPVELFPGNRWLGWLWPAIGFGAWHLAPQEIHPSAMGRARYAVAAAALGASWGWVAHRTTSVRLTTVSHVLTDGSGIRSARLFLPGR